MLSVCFSSFVFAFAFDGIIPFQFPDPRKLFRKAFRKVSLMHVTRIHSPVCVYRQTEIEGNRSLINASNPNRNVEENSK